MDDRPWWWPLEVLGGPDDVLVLVLVVGAFWFRSLPSTRRWAPRGNARPAPPRPAAQRRGDASMTAG